VRSEESLVQVRFETRIIYWRGPSPFFFAPIPPQYVEELRRVSKAVTYGWGMVPVEARIGDVVFTTAMFPKDETYLLPLKAAVRRKANITAGDLIAVDMTIQPPTGAGDPISAFQRRQE
jgi:hypothetical protein